MVVDLLVVSFLFIELLVVSWFPILYDNSLPIQSDTTNPEQQRVVVDTKRTVSLDLQLSSRSVLTTPQQSVGVEIPCVSSGLYDNQPDPIGYRPIHSSRRC